MKKSQEELPKRRRGKHSAAEKLKVAKLFVEEGYTRKQIAEEFNISEWAVSSWSKQYCEHGAGAFTAADPGQLPEVTAASGPDFVTTRIVEHKEAHPDHGIKRIAQIFKRFLGLNVSTHQVRQALESHDLNNSEAPSRRRKKSVPGLRFFERNAPNELWHTDVMYYTFKGAKLFFIGYLDDYSRYVVGLEVFHSQTVGHTLDLLKKSCADYHYPKEILTDGGRQFCSWTGKSQFGTFLRKNDIKHTVCRAHHPQTNGKLERFWHTLRSEFLEKAKFNTFEELNERLAMFIKHYNFQRPHQGIGGMTPADRFFEVESEVKKQLEQQIRENALELALRGQVKNPFYMVGRIGDKNVAILEEKGRISMQVDGVPCPDGSPVQFNLQSGSNLNIKPNLENQIVMEDIDHGNENCRRDAVGDDRRSDEGKIPADCPGGEMQSGAGDLDGKGNGECDLPPAGGAAAAGGALGGTSSGGDVQGAGGFPERAEPGESGWVVEPSGQAAGETSAGPAGKDVLAGGESGEGQSQTPGREFATGNWKLSSDCSNLSITI